MPDDAAKQPRARLEFDQRRFASIMSTRRSVHGWSTRELARRAGMSQPYVVALERGAINGPTPTVELVARLAHALGIDPTELFEQSLRPAGRHVLLVVDGPEAASLDMVRRITAPDRSDAVRWVWAASSAAGRGAGAGADTTIDLHRQPIAPYDPEHVEQALDRELDTVSTATAGLDLGFVFADTSRVMVSAGQPGVVLDFERRWADVVADTARRHGARAAWNICVYELADLRCTHDPLGTAVELVRSHDDVWCRQGGRATTGRAAVTKILRPLAPPGTTSSASRARVGSLVDELTHVA